MVRARRALVRRGLAAFTLFVAGVALGGSPSPDSSAVARRRQSGYGASATLAKADRPIPRSPNSVLAGEVDAKGLTALIARQKGKVVLVNFWATWCVPCREEFPELVQLQKLLGPQGLQVIGISTDFASAMPAVERFLSEQTPSFPNYHRKSAGDPQVFIEAVDKNWGGELPFSVLYDRQGKKVQTLSDKHSLAEYEKAARVLLK